MDKDEFYKIDRLLDAIDHPENYSEDELDEIANDPDTSGLYADLCRTRSSAFASGQLSDEEIDRQWAKFNMRKKRSAFAIAKIGRRAAIWTAVAVASCSAVSIGISVGIREVKQPTYVDERAIATDSLITITTLETDTVTKSIETSDILFDGETLQAILDRMAPHYGLKVVYKNDAAKKITLFYNWNPATPLRDIVDDFNTFERIQISLQDDTLTVF